MCYAPVMKQILSHFKISIMLGAALIATFTNSQTISIFADANTSTDPIISDNSESTETEIPSSPELPSDQFTFTSDLVIKSINPGYTVDGTQNVGEFIELQRTTDDSLSLANYSVRYTTSSGKSTILLNFSEGSMLVGEFLLMRLARSPESDQSDITYMTTLAMGAGTVEILYNDVDVVDTICWGNVTTGNCVDAFKGAKPTTLARKAVSGTFEHLTEYTPTFDPLSPSLVFPSPNPPEESQDPSEELDDDSEPDPLSSHCYGLEFSEILSYYADDKSEQFIELYNPTDRDINLSYCSLRYKNKTYPLFGTIQANSYSAIYPTKLSSSLALTKNPNSSNTVELISADQSIVDVLVYSHGQKKSTSYAKFYDATGAEIWEITYSVTPSLENNYQEFRTCPEGKVINPDTGNCVKNSATTSTNTTECPAGKYRNPLTGRCKNIESSSTELKPCAEGYERNPETNRCRKTVAENDGAGYALVPTTSDSKSTFIALGAVILIVSFGIIYIILQFRHEIARAIRKIKQRLHHVR